MDDMWSVEQRQQASGANQLMDVGESSKIRKDAISTGLPPPSFKCTKGGGKMESSSVFCDATSDYEEEERSAIQEMDSSFAAPPSPTSSKSADSKRSSATSGVESSSEMNDAETRDANDVEEEEDEKTSNKYEEVDIAKILHTRKRIHQTLNRPSALQSSIDHLPTVQQQQQQQQQNDDNNNKTLKKRTSKLSKYGTLSRRKTPVSAPVESASGSGGGGLASRFSFAPPTSPDGTSAATSSSFASRTGAVFNYNTVGRRRNKPRPNIALISSPIDLNCSSTSRFDYPNLATTAAANQRWGIQQGDPLSPPTSPVDSDEGKQAKRKKRWTSSIRRLVSIGSSSSSDRDRIKEEKKASIRLHDASLDLSFQSLDLSSSSATGRKLSGSGSSYYLGHMTTRGAIDRDLFSSPLEERIISETINNDSATASNPAPPAGISRKKSFKKMFKSLKLSSSSSGNSTLPRKKQRDKQ